MPVLHPWYILISSWWFIYKSLFTKYMALEHSIKWLQARMGSNSGGKVQNWQLQFRTL